jgi:hypothetical protein
MNRFTNASPSPAQVKMNNIFADIEAEIKLPPVEDQPPSYNWFLVSAHEAVHDSCLGVCVRVGPCG